MGSLAQAQSYTGLERVCMWLRIPNTDVRKICEFLEFSAEFHKYELKIVET